MESKNPFSVAPRHILKLSVEEKRQFLNSFDCVLMDIDGVLWNFAHPIPKSGDGVNALQTAGKAVNFITNNSVRPIESLKRNIEALGINIDVNSIWHPAKSIITYLKSINFNELIYVIGTEEVKKLLREAGFQIIEGPNKIIDENTVLFCKEVLKIPPVGAVIMDFDFNISTLKLTQAQVCLNRPDCLFIIAATDLMLPLGNNISLLGPGHFSSIFTNLLPNKPLIFGKPGKDLGNLLFKESHIEDPKRILMIGDMLEQDISFGNKCGFQTLAVMSGGCTEKELFENTRKDFSPGYYADSVNDFVQFMKEIKKSIL